MVAEEFMRLSLDQALELALFYDSTGRIFYANASAKTALEYTDFSECSIRDVFPGLFPATSGSAACGLPTTESQVQTDAYRMNRTCFPVTARFIALDANSTAALAYDATADVQAKKLMQNVDQQIEDAVKVKSEFTANITHELRTPVNGISGNTRELLERETDPAKIKRLDLIERGCRDMHAIINNVLDFSKLEAGKFTLENREFVFRDMIEYAVSNHKPKIDEKGLDFFLTVAEDIPERVVGDELRIVQILNNLLSNAVKFTSVGKIILEVVKTAQINNRVELFFLVIDSGIGIAKENQDKLFQSFSQVDASISRKYGGTGLGLNITKQLVEMMGGNIHLESEYGKGSMFSFHIWLEIPKDEISDAPAEAPSGDTHASYSFADFGIEDAIWQFGSSENLDELGKKLSKLILCIDMENWEKAEGFADTVKRLTANGPKEIKTTALRLKMAVQKEDTQKAEGEHKSLLEAIEAWKAGDGNDSDE